MPEPTPSSKPRVPLVRKLLLVGAILLAGAVACEIAARVRMKAKYGRSTTAIYASERDPATVLERQHELARSLVVERGSGDAVVARRAREAWCADRALGRRAAERPLAQRTGRLARNHELGPAIGA